MLLFFQQLANGLIIGMNYSLVAIGLTIIFGILDIINMVQGTFFMVGAYTAYFMVTYLHLNYFVAIPVAMAVTALLAILCELASVRPLRGQHGIVFLLSTMGMMVLLENLALVLWGPEPRELSSPLAHKAVVIFDIYLTQQKIFLLIFSALIVYLLTLFIKKSRIGRGMRAVAADEYASSLMGINVNHIFMITFGLGGALSAAAGALLGPMFDIDPLMGHLTLIKAFIIVIMGGMGNITGAFYCGLILGVSESLGAAYVSTAYRDVFGLIIMVLVLLFRPEGLLGKEGLK